MKTQFLLAATAALSLTACGQPAATEATAEKAAASAEPAKAAPADKEAATPAVVGAFSKQYVTGKWAEESDGDCKLAQDFKADGTVDGFFESWKVEGDKLVVTVMGETQSMSAKAVDAKHMDLQMDGKTKRFIRC